MRYIIDSYAWIEYLEGSELGKKVYEVLTNKNNEIFSLNLTIIEIISRVKRKKGDVEIAYNAITANSKVVEINQQIAKKAGLFHTEIKKKINNFGLIDALLLTLARELNAKILTGDIHFKDFKEAIFIK